MTEQIKPANQINDGITSFAPGDNNSFTFNELEKQLESELAAHLSDVQLLEEQKATIGNPESLGKTIMDVVWIQFINQIGTIAGEDFIKENRNLPLDLSRDAHIQTVENFAEGKIATHNTHTDYQERYDTWQGKLKKVDGKIETHTSTRTGEVLPTLNKYARKPFDQGRPVGSKEKGTAIDHIVPAAKIIRDPAANAFMTEEEQVAFANSEVNLNEMDARQNQSKSDYYTEEWLDNPNSKGQKPSESVGVTPEEDKRLRKVSKKARKEYENKKKEAEARAIAEGKQSRTEETLRMGGKALRAALLGLLAQLVRKIIGKLVAWLKEKNRNLDALVNKVKDAIVDFFKDIKSNLMVSADTAITSVIVSAVGDFIRKIWVMLKQAARSVIEAINYLKKPENRKKSVGVLTLEVGKIIVTGLTAAGAIFLGEVITKALSTIPVFAINIPLIGSLASIIGMFLSSVIMGIVGALVMNLIDVLIAKTQKIEITKQQIDKNNDVIATQERIIVVKRLSSINAREKMLDDLEKRHAEATAVINKALDDIFGPVGLPETI